MTAARQRIAQDLAKEATAAAAFLVAYAGGWEDADRRPLSQGGDLDTELDAKAIRLGKACIKASGELAALRKG